MVVVKVMDGIEPRPEHLVTTVQVIKIGTRVMRAGVAVAGGVERAVIIAILGIANFHHPLAGEQVAIARVARGHDAIELVNAARHRLHQIAWGADAHQITGFVGGQARGQGVQHGETLVFGLAHREAADGVAIKTNGFERA